MNNNIEDLALDIVAQFEVETEMKNATFSEEQANEMMKKIGDVQSFKACMPVFRDAVFRYKEVLEKQEATTKNSQEAKKIWKTRLDLFLNGFLGRALDHYGETSIGGDDNSKISSTTRDNLVVDDEKLIGLWQPLISSLQASLPPFLKVTVSVDKRALTDYCRTEEDLLATHSDIVSTVEKRSTIIK